MTYRIEHSSVEGVLQVDVSGTLAPSELVKLRGEIGRIARDAGAQRLLVDVRRLRHEVGPVETLRLVETYGEEKPAWKTAVLETEEQAAANQFHETAAVNRGFRVLHFTGRAKALAWLTA